MAVSKSKHRAGRIGDEFLMRTTFYNERAEICRARESKWKKRKIKLIRSLQQFKSGLLVGKRARGVES